MARRRLQGRQGRSGPESALQALMARTASRQEMRLVHDDIDGNVAVERQPGAARRPTHSKRKGAAVSGSHFRRGQSVCARIS
jgi:hypothetical protein